MDIQHISAALRPAVHLPAVDLEIMEREGSGTDGFRTALFALG
jgi:hypothetical protein